MMSMRGVAASLALALLLLTPLAGAMASRARTSCSMSCCLSGAHACPMRSSATTCRACTSEASAHATSIAKVVIAMPAIVAPLTGAVVAAQHSAVTPLLEVAPPPVPPPQRG